MLLPSLHPKSLLVTCHVDIKSLTFKNLWELAIISGKNLSQNHYCLGYFDHCGTIHLKDRPHSHQQFLNLLLRKIITSK